MGQVSVTLNDRTYRLVCDDGEEDRLVELASYVKAKVDQLTREIGHVGDERLVLMAALLIADELWDARSDLDVLSAPAREIATRTASADPEPVKRLKSLAAKMTAQRDGTAPSEDAMAPAASPSPPQGSLAAAKSRRRDVA